MGNTGYYKPPDLNRTEAPFIQKEVFTKAARIYSNMLPSPHEMANASFTAGTYQKEET